LLQYLGISRNTDELLVVELGDEMVLELAMESLTLMTKRHRRAIS
jgi:hypothetical protein